MFSLCCTSTKTKHQEGPCAHDDDARTLTGAWVAVEFKKALELSYRKLQKNGT